MDRFQLEIDSFAEGVRVVAFVADERISTLGEAKIYVVVAAEALAALQDALTRPGTLTVPAVDEAASLRIPGVVSDVAMLHAFADQVLCEVVLRPPLWQLTLEHHSRVWIDKAALEVVEELLQKGGVDPVQIEAHESYVTHEHICQIRESDYAFIARWLERDGLHYFAEPTEAGATLRISDGAYPGDAHPPDGVRCVGALDAGQGAAGPVLTRFGVRRAARSAHVAVGDYFYPQPALAIAEQHAVVDPATGTTVRFGDRAWSPAEARRLAKVRAEQAAAEATLFEGEGTVVGLSVGYGFEIVEHPDAGLVGSYRAVGLRHLGLDPATAEDLLGFIDPAARVLRRGVATYRVRVHAVRADTPYRPSNGAVWPQLLGLEHARIDGEADGEYAQLDDAGRYRLKLLFDENASSPGGASARVRMLQPHGGNPEGCHFPLRKGTEVLVSFVDGDPDRPVIVGAVPNPETPSPVTSANNTLNVIVTGGENRIEIEDQEGSQYVVLYSPPEQTTLHLGAAGGPYGDGHHARLSTAGVARVHAGGNRHITIGGEQTEEVQGPLVEDYHSNQTTHVYAAWDETIDASATQTISAGETRTVTGGVDETITGGETRDVSADQSESVSAGVTRTIGASWQQMVGANADRLVGGSEDITVGGSATLLASGGIEISTPGTLSVTTGGSATFVTPGGFNIVAGGGFHNIDGEWVKCGPTEIETFMEKAMVVGIKGEIAGAVLSVIGSRNSLTTAKVAYVATEFETEAAHDESAGAEQSEGGALIWTTGNHTHS